MVCLNAGTGTCYPFPPLFLSYWAHKTQLGGNQVSIFRQKLSFSKDVSALETIHVIVVRSLGKHLIQSPHTDEETEAQELSHLPKM